jgi:hypothetical protein
MEEKKLSLDKFFKDIQAVYSPPFYVLLSVDAKGEASVKAIASTMDDLSSIRKSESYYG